MREIYETREEYEMAMRSGIGNNYILPMESNEEVKVLQEKLEIAVKALEFYEKPFACFHPEYNVAQHHKKAAEALAKIKEIK